MEIIIWWVRNDAFDGESCRCIKEDFSGGGTD